MNFPTILRRVSTFVFALTLFAAPWAYGGVLTATQPWLLHGVCIALALFGLSQLGGQSQRQSLPPAFIPLALALLLGTLQLVPLPSGAARIVAPHNYQLRTQLTSDANRPFATDHQSPTIDHQSPSPISLRPESTRQDLALLTLAVSSFYLAYGLFTTPRTRVALLWAVTTNGAAFSLFGLIQLLTWNGRHYWIGLTPGGGSPFAAYASRNAAAGYLNLCLAAAFGVIIWTVMRNATSSAEHAKHRPSGMREGLLEFVSSLSALKLLALFLAGLIAGGVVSALSRGGILSMFAAAAVTSLGLAVTRSERRQLVWFAIAAIAGVGLVCWVGLGDTVEDRLATLSNVEEQTSTGRPPLWKDSIQAVPDFLPMGSGLGTYREVYRQYQHRLDPKWYYHAENQYLEALIDAGVPGLLLMLTMIGLVGLAAFRLLTRSNELTMYATGIAGTFALVSQAVHGFFDFGLYLPANFMLLAALSACVLAAAHQIGLPKECRARSGQQARVRVARGALAVVLCLACLWAAWEIRTAANQQQLLSDTRFAMRPGGTTDSSIAAAIPELASQLDRHGDLAKVHYQLSRLWTLRYRQRKLDQLRRTTPADVTLDTLWLRTSPTGLHRRAHETVQNGDLEQMREDPMVKEFLVPALHHLLKARQSAPLESTTHLRIGQLCWLYEDLSDDQKHFDRALMLRPSDPELMVKIGTLQFQAGRVKEARDIWRQALTLDVANTGSHLDVIMASGIDNGMLVSKVFPDSPERLLDLAMSKFAGEETVELKTAILSRADTLINRLEDEHLQAYWRGRSLSIRKQYPQAIRSYIQAVAGRPNQAAWRYELALLLRGQGLDAEAREQAVRCTQLEPENGQYQALLDALSE